MSVEFQDFSIKVQEALEEASLRFLEEASTTIQTQAEDNTPVDTGQLKQNWNHVVDERELEATVGNPLEYSIWVEMGTGEYAVEGNGRKGGWFYVDDEGKGHFTMGSKPVRMLHNAFQTKKNAVIRRAQQIFKERLGK